MAMSGTAAELAKKLGDNGSGQRGHTRDAGIFRGFSLILQTFKIELRGWLQERLLHLQGGVVDVVMVDCLIGRDQKKERMPHTNSIMQGPILKRQRQTES